MSLSAAPTSISYIGTGAVSTYSFPFKGMNKSYIKVRKRDASDNEIPMVLDVDFTVANVTNPNGGSITLTAGNLPLNYTILIERVIPLAQDAGFRTQGTFSPEVHDDAFDKAMGIAQQIDGKVTRSLFIPATVEDADGELETWETGRTVVTTPTGFTLSAPPSGTAVDVLADLASTDAGKGASLVGYLAPYTGAVARTQHDKNVDLYSLKDFGAKGDGTTDDTTAVTAAFVYGRFSVPEGTYIISSIPVVNNVYIYGCGKYKSIFKQKAASTQPMISNRIGDFLVAAYDVGFDGNGANQTLAAACGVCVAVGSLTLERCDFHDIKGHAIWTGNAEQGTYNVNTYAHDVNVRDCTINQGLSGTGYGDCMRIFRTQFGEFSGNIVYGGSSGIRTQDYCTYLRFIGNIVRSSYADVGITITLSTNCEIIGNTCQANFSHGIEANSCIRVTIANNICTGNGVNGLQVEAYVPPVGAGFEGYLEGLLVTNATSPTLLANKDYVITGNVFGTNGKFGAQIGSADGVVVTGNRFSGNAVAAVGGINHGLYIHADATGAVKDNVQVFANEFENTGLQTASILRAEAQNTIKTVVKGNIHIGGNIHLDGVAPIGGVNLMTDRFLLADATVISGTVFPIAADTTSITGFARQVVDASGAASASSGFVIQPISRYGEKVVHIRLRTPDTMTSITLIIQLYKAGAFVATVLNTGITLTTAWLDIITDIPAALSSNDYAQILVTIITDVALQGKVNIEQLNCYLPCE